MIKFLIVLLMIQSSLAVEECTVENSQSTLDELTQNATRILTCPNPRNPEIAELAVGCLSGGKKSVSGAVDQFIEIAKFLFAQVPTWIYKESKHLVDGEVDPASMATKIANVHIKSQAEIWEMAKSYWHEFKKFTQDLKNEVLSQVKGFPCLSAREQAEIVCRGVMDIWFLSLGPTAFIKGAKWGYENAKAMKAFVQEVKALEGSTLLEKLTNGTRTLKQSAEKGIDVMKFRDSRLFEVSLPNGQKVLKYESKMNGTTVVRDVPLDAKTLAIDSNSAIGKEVMEMMFKEKSQAGAVIFIDVNYLGKVNYYSRRAQGGDEYLTNVGESIRKSLRPGDIVFKNGGDELVVILGTNSPKTVKEISQRMINEVDSNPGIRDLFRHEVSKYAQKYRDVNKAKSYSELPEATKKSLSAEEKRLAEADFTGFKEIKKSEIEASLKEQSNYRGSISVGSTLIRREDKIEDAIFRADKQAGDVKSEYKTRFENDDSSKYKTEKTTSPVQVPRYAPPQALDPT